MTEPEYERPAQDAESILLRASCLAALIDRSVLEAQWIDGDATSRQKLATYSQSILDWLRNQNLRTALSPNEVAMLRKPFGTWTFADRFNGSWRSECLAVLAWALGLLEKLPPYDTQIDEEQVSQFGPNGAELGALRSQIKFRSAKELGAGEATADQWHWYAVQVQELHPVPAEGESFDRQAPRPQQLRQALGREVKLYGKNYEDLTFIEFSKARSLALERHYAFEWIWSGDPWDEVITDTMGLAPDTH